MSLTLDATLQANQDGLERHPIVDITAQAATTAIPFYGSLLTSETVNEKSPAPPINHSSGRICGAYVYGPDGSAYSLKYIYSDVNRSYYTTATFALGTYNAIGVSLCELVDGNIGLVWLEQNGTTYYLKQRIITVAGTAVSNATIATLSSLSFMSGPALIRDAETNGYTLIYTKISGSDYYAYKRTSTDFATWASESQLSIAGLTSTWKLFDPDLKQVTNYDYVLSFAVVESVGPNGEELSNIYQSISTDGGANWGTATKITNYTQYSEIATHPVFVEKEENSGYLVINEKKAALYCNYLTSGWPGGATAYDKVQSMHFDSTNGKIYALMDVKTVVQIDVSTWTITNSWSTSTTPALHSFFDYSSIYFWRMNHSAGQYVVIGTHTSPATNFCQLIDGENNTITTYAFENIESYSVTANVSGWSSTANTAMQGTFIDLTNNRIWFMFSDGSTFYPQIRIGYISLTDSGPTYEYHEVVTDSDINDNELTGLNRYGEIKVYPSDDLIIINGYGSYERSLAIYTLSTGVRQKKYKYSDYPQFPYYGVIGNHYKGGKVYGGVYQYTSLYGQENIRGLVIIDTETDIITYSRPSYATLDDYKLGRFHEMADGRFLIASSVSGVVIYDPVADTWEAYNSTTIPGLNTDFNSIYLVDYDETNDLIFCGGDSGVDAISVDGNFEQAQYSVATYAGGAWSYGTASNLVSGVVDYDASIVCDPTSYGITAFWVNRNGTEYSIKTGSDTGEFSLKDYIVRGKAISITRSIDGNPNQLSFTLSHGHLFDPFNNTSAWRSILDKGNKVKVRFGELISDTEYWQDQGTFHITSKKLQYKKGQYPTIQIKAQDIRYLWKDMNIVATDYYDGQQPDDVIEDLLTDNTSLTVLSDMSVPTFDSAVEVDIQWTNTGLLDCVQQLCDRFGYFHRMTVDNKFSCRKIASDNSLDHTYTNSNQILSVSPDDSFSSFTNRVTVEGAERDYSEVLYTEERVATLNGTVGWWGFDKDFTIYYSTDQSKRVRYPRLKVIETTTSIGFELAGNISEQLIDSDATELSCVIRVEAPSLVPYLVAFVAAKEASSWLFDEVIPYAEITYRIGTAICNILSVGIMLILGACGNFQYEVWGQPVGEEKRSVEATADDEELQGKIGYVLEERIEDALCFTVAECQQVADHELFISTAQQKRLSIEKVTHLQDEEGDTIRFVHPYSNQNMDVFVTELTREYVIPEAGSSEEASCTDHIEGWYLS